MLQFGKDQARRFIDGAAYSYQADIREAQITVSLKSYSDEHSTPQQRFYNLLCMAYGANQEVFSGLMDKGYLPPGRGKRCMKDFGELAFAFKHLIRPHLDTEMAEQVMETEWLRKEDAKSAHQ
jgi:hypothetical protein